MKNCKKIVNEKNSIEVHAYYTPKTCFETSLDVGSEIVKNHK